MNEKVLKITEWAKITAMLADFCKTPIGRESALSCVPLGSPEEVTEALEKTEAAVDRIRLFGPFSASGARDIRESLLRLKVGSHLSMKEIYDIGVLLKATDRVSSYGKKTENEDSLTGLFSSLEPLTAFRKTIEETLLSEEEMADTASPALASIRRKIRSEEAKIRTELNDILAANASYLQDHVITMRDNRYCIPVKSEFRSQVSGMVHDESASGSTIFIEPMRIVKANNEIRHLEVEEEKEIAAILASLSETAEGYREILSVNLSALSELDFIFAKATLASEMKATKPILRTDAGFKLKEARHPLLNTEKIVPIDVSLGEDFDTLIITGPNTGGKTVSLKTIGLLTLMGLSGLFIPAFDGSSIAFFREIYADIGDEQSIEQNLSTFSSHMKNLVDILKKADGLSLVLLDELCAGTDPEEGASLAIAILSALRRRKARIAVTTHYSELKLFALSEKGVENGCCEFDVATLSPTYHLLIGIPGKSNAFAISSKLGLSGEIIKEAKEGLDTHHASFEDVLRDLNHSKRQIEKEKRMIQDLKKEEEEIRNSLQKEDQRLSEKEEKILKKARDEAARMLAEAKAQLDDAVRTAREHGGDMKALENMRTKTREKLSEATKKEQKAVRKSKTAKDEIAVGKKVRVLSMDMDGTVLSLPNDKGFLYVEIGSMKTRLPLSDIEIAENQETKSAKKTIYPSFSSADTISIELNVIGKTTDEAIRLLDRYLDDAYGSHLLSVRIVHGKGTGALRRAIQKRAKEISYVKSVRDGEYGEGDAGVSVITFRYD